jgi:RsiW-degrading membrane proteinase PrsW (M82 family)
MATAQDNRPLLAFHRPSLTEKIFFFVSGIITSIPLTLFVGTFADSLCVVLPVFYATLCSVAVFAPFVEEFAKAYPLFYRHGETERSIFTLGFLVGLGFGVAEFLLYVIVLKAPVYVRLPIIFLHAGTTSIIAYGIAKKRTALFYLVAVLLHFSNNFSALIMQFRFIGGPAWVITYFLSWHLYRKTSEKIVD